MGAVPSRLIEILRLGIKGATWKIKIIHKTHENDKCQSSKFKRNPKFKCDEFWIL
jgi:hypothetical protein